MSPPLLEVENLRTWFHTDTGTAKAVDGVSFAVTEGEVLGIVGESGCGKSVTSLSIMQLIARPPGEIMSGSSIRFKGEELVGAGEKRMRALRGDDIAMIFQEPMTSLNPVHRVGFQIAEVLQLHRGMKAKEARARAVDLLRLVGIPNADERVDSYPHHLSGGQRQRVMIAMALACEPELLIADEPTTALDVTIQAQILDLLAELRARLRMAVILITHDLGVVAEVCDRVVVMYAGQVVEQGTVEQLFNDPRHPYTEGLLKAVPRLGRKLEQLAVIPGTVPNPIAWPIGCRFHTRCPYGWDLCVREQPPLLQAAAAVPSEAATAARALSPASQPRRAGDLARVARCWLEEHPARRAEIRARGVFTDERGAVEAPAEQYHRSAAASGAVAAPEQRPPPEALLPDGEREDAATQRYRRGETRGEE